MRFLLSLALLLIITIFFNSEVKSELSIDTDIKILSSTGKLVFQTNDYLNNWPMESIEFSNVNPVFYYIISPINQSPKKGTITVIK